MLFYSARKLIAGDWINDKDEYLAPLRLRKGYERWVDDCHVYLPLRSNNMSAMRGVEYKGQTYNIHNHFFFLTRQEALDLYGSHKQARAFTEMLRVTRFLTKKRLSWRT